EQPAGHIVANLKDGSWDTVRHGNYPVACVGLKTPTRCTSTEFIGEPVPPCDPEWLPSTNVEPHLYVLMVTARFNYTKEPFINYSLYLNR
ncbi:unnamed protein product, partial [Mesorhabditis spiculigera]